MLPAQGAGSHRGVISSDEDALSELSLSSRSSLSDRALAWRDRLLSSPRFQNWASRFPLTRPIAQRRARALFDIVAGFVYAQVLAACVEIRLFEILKDNPQSCAELADRLSIPPDSMLRLLKAAVSLELLGARSSDKSGNARFGLGPLGATMVGNPGIAAMVAHHRMLYADLSDPVSLLRSTKPGQAPPSQLSAFWPYARAEKPSALARDATSPYSALMSASQSFVAAEILDAFPLSGFHCLMDAGGGAGDFLVAAAARAPLLQMMLCDLPSVAQLAQTRFAVERFDNRARAIACDIVEGPLPEGADVISLIRVLHDHDDDAALMILTNARRALPASGTIMVAEPMSGTPGAAPAGDAYFGFYLLAMGSGRPRTPNEISCLLRSAGFNRIQRIRTNNPLLVGIITACASA